MLQSASNIRVFVRWLEQTVFAGENIECEITFQNTAAVPVAPRPVIQTNNFNGFRLGGERQQKTTPLQVSGTQVKTPTGQGTRPLVSGRRHQTALSLNVSAGSDRLQQGSTYRSDRQSEAGSEPRPHRRSLSIVSLGIADRSGEERPAQQNADESTRKQSKGHVRASSLHILPRRSGNNGTGPLSATFPHRSRTQPSPLFHTSSSSGDFKSRLDTVNAEASYSAGRQSSVANLADNPNTRKVSPNSRRKGSASFPHNFRFPAATSPLNDQRFPSSVSRENNAASLYVSQISSKLPSQRPKEEVPTIKEQTSSLMRISSPTSNGGTPRSSGEFYSLSNNSTETLASEYFPQQSGRAQQHEIHTRRISNIAAANQSTVPEILMMGYAQIHGSFALDGSLVNQAPFEEVKRKGVLSGQGGGVIGIETSKRESGLLRGFGWSNIGESIGGLLGGGELSSMREMRGIASSRAIPLLSTPQTILFVDLRLAPGESRSYRYSFRLPRGLPPTHRGRAIKISYNLVIGTQRPGGAKEQQVKSVEIPFRILGSVNAHGELLGHELTSPYIVMRDQAQVQSLESNLPIATVSSQRPKPVNSSERRHSSLDEFLTYVEDLLTRPRQNSSLGLLSPTDTHASRRPSFIAEPSSSKEAIDLAILRSNLATNSQQSANRFEIARNGRRVAVVMLARPAYRLGETIVAAIDFAGADVPCYALHALLETSERVDNAIALRSDASVHRVTRKIHSSHSESTLFTRRVIFSPTIPPTATPSFITSGVSLEWKIVIEFVTPRFDKVEESNMLYASELLEQTSTDDRGVILAAAEMIECESFEIAVPLRIYGALTGPTREDEEAEGFVV